MPEIISIASSCGYRAIELRFVEGEDALYKLPAFHGDGLNATRRQLSDYDLSICCVDTSCRFHFPDAKERSTWIEEGQRMAELAAELSAPSIRVFGDQIQPGADRGSTRQWIADSMTTLAERIDSSVQVWLETHGDFASSAETNAILDETSAYNVGVIWDAPNCWTDFNESPQAGAAGLDNRLRHVHIKDLHHEGTRWVPVLTGEGEFPLQALLTTLRERRYDGYLSFEWEKKWHPAIPDAGIALPHFAHWFRHNNPARDNNPA
jgi:sugar phosphate isomerase/epimerase